MDSNSKQRLLNNIRRFASYMDAIPGLPFGIGLDPLIGLIPGIGDFAGVLISLYQVYLSTRFGIPITLIGMMLLNIFIDALIGMIPAVGDFLDVVYKANVYNLQLLENWLAKNDATFVREGTTGGQFVNRKPL
ncbi:hypothetical protein K493DRAFT_313276 [Basidiobolus meristosporus CBS 931.73]|uniref:DUF4112 domain-containing protein n=1 Tax=Basidiobolus meristosporus CBS 931.73 TaxID=1314790 RepID=A0A1Y1YMU1_9FUNG|nr:hypothetical protein K493DRAFT_313276 [Basidiobolus meristosporus CBS 931.73]|eukprot:ORX99342.1 hypothetical protein K493DRAFT_313276 [Basidiobolus meristosporus CBS 931.73]